MFAPIMYILLFLLILFVCSFFVFKQNIFAWFISYPQPSYRYTLKKDVMITMSDGTHLATDIYQPKGKGPFPSILLRTPYGKSNPSHRYSLAGQLFASQGYVVLVQDVRGKNGSEGKFIPYEKEGSDGFETLEWISEAPWFNGQVALFGFSYLASCAWLAATYRSPHISTIIPLFSCQSTYKGWFNHGVPFLKDMLFWLTKYAGKSNNLDNEEVTHEEVDKVLQSLPIVGLDKIINKEPISIYQKFLHHPASDVFWDHLSPRHKIKDLSSPVLFYAGWYDRLLGNTLVDFEAMEATPSGPYNKLIIGPWVHDPTQVTTDITFPKNAKFLLQLRTILDWCDYWLKKKPLPIGKERITYYLMGLNIWKKTDQWPPVGVQFRSYYLKEKGLSTELGAQNENGKYCYNPADPTPSLGTPLIYANGCEGPREQSPLTSRPDVLAFRSRPLSENLLVVGPLKAILYVSSTAVDTDFCVKLADVHPDGKAYYLQSGFLRMRYRDSLYHPELMIPGQIYRIEVEMSHIAQAFLKGHCIQLQICSADFPNHSRNLNMAELPEVGTEFRVAEQTIHYGGSFDSQVILPILQEK